VQPGERGLDLGEAGAQVLRHLGRRGHPRLGDGTVDLELDGGVNVGFHERNLSFS
jgi:hypothetical protein